MEKVLVTGGTGLVGTYLIPYLKSKGYDPYVLSRKKSKNANTMYWNPARGHIDLTALQKMDYIVHLAGANVFEKSWNDQNKKEIIESRVEGARLLSQAFREHKITPKAFITASAIGIYGVDTGDQWCTEETPTGPGFLSKVVAAWEKEADTVQAQGIRTIKLRIGLVLSKDGGLFDKLVTPTKFGLGSAIGSGKQFMPWIDVHDLSAMVEFAMKSNISGVYNAVAPEPVTNLEFSKMLAAEVKRPFFMPALPAFALRLAFGREKAAVLLGGNRVSPKKIQDAGFKFSYSDLKSSFKHLLNM